MAAPAANIFESLDNGSGAEPVPAAASSAPNPFEALDNQAPIASSNPMETMTSPTASNADVGAAERAYVPPTGNSTSDFGQWVDDLGNKFASSTASSLKNVFTGNLTAPVDAGTTLPGAARFQAKLDAAMGDVRPYLPDPIVRGLTPINNPSVFGEKAGNVISNVLGAGQVLAPLAGLAGPFEGAELPVAEGDAAATAAEAPRVTPADPPSPSQTLSIANGRRAPATAPAIEGPTLNVGTHVTGGQPITPEQITSEIEKTGAKVVKSSVVPSNTEPTVVATLDRPLTPDEGNTVAANLHQEAIPQAHPAGGGEIFGPQAEKWGPFNPNYFIDHNGQPLESEPNVPLGAQPVPTDRAARVQGMQSLGVTTARESAAAGDLQGTSDDVQTAKLNSPGGKIMRDQLDTERTALQDRGNELVQRSGGTGGVDSQALDDRGHVMSAPLEAAHERIDTAMGQMYDEAKTEAQSRGAVMGTTNLDKWISDNEKAGTFIRSTDAADLRQRIASARDLFKMNAGDGGTVENAENFRKWIGGAYDPRTADLNYGLKDALDADVGAAGGAELYQKARALRQFRAANFDQPKGVSSLIASSKAGQLGLNRPVPFERIPDFITNLPNDQFDHVINTYGNIGKMFPDMADDAGKAIQEVRAHQANRLVKAGNSTQGMWNAKAVTAEVDKMAPKIQRVWDPAGQQMIRELQQGGEIMRNDNAYKGAAVQAHNLMTAAVGGVGKVAEMGGAAMHGFPGYIAGHVLKNGTEWLNSKMAESATRARLIDLTKEPAAGGGPAAPGPFSVGEPELPGRAGLESIKPYLLDDELPTNKSVAQRLVDFYHSLPPTEEKAAFAAEGASMRDWYRGGAEAIGGWFKQDAPRFTALLAADSPQYPVASNLEESVNIWKAWHEAGRPQDRAAISKILTDQGAHLHGGEGVGESTLLNNVHEALSADDPSNLVLSGPKVHSFYKNLMGHVDEVTNDGWQAKGSSVDPAALGGSKNAAGTQPGKGVPYRAMSAKTREAAALLSNISGEKWAPDQIQAGEWSFIKSAWEMANKTGRSIPDLLKSGELNDQIISSVPSYQQLLDQHAEKLQSIGLTGPAKLRGGASSITPSQATTTAREALRASLFKGAQRLEAYRQHLKAGGEPGTGPGANIPFTGGEAGADVPFEPARTYTGQPPAAPSTANAPGATLHIDPETGATVFGVPKAASTYNPAPHENPLVKPQLQAWEAAHNNGDENIEYAHAWDANGKPVFGDGRIGNENSVKFNGHEIDAMRKGGQTIMSHTHPSGDLSLSRQDLQFASHANLAQIRAVSRNYIHSMTRGPKGWPTSDSLLSNYQDQMGQAREIFGPPKNLQPSDWNNITHWSMENLAKRFPENMTYERTPRPK